jgi:hypothetical protein
MRVILKPGGLLVVLAVWMVIVGLVFFLNARLRNAESNEARSKVEVGRNLVRNASFESLTDPANKRAIADWLNTEQGKYEGAGSEVSTKFPAGEGKRTLVHNTLDPYDATTSQRIANLSEGTYTFSVLAQGGPKTTITVTPEGGKPITFRAGEDWNPNEWGKWKLLFADNIALREGSACTISFRSKGGVFLADDVKFARAR